MGIGCYELVPVRVLFLCKKTKKNEIIKRNPFGVTSNHSSLTDAMKCVKCVICTFCKKKIAPNIRKSFVLFGCIHLFVPIRKCIDIVGFLSVDPRKSSVIHVPPTMSTLVCRTLWEKQCFFLLSAYMHTCSLYHCQNTLKMEQYFTV